MTAPLAARLAEIERAMEAGIVERTHVGWMHRALTRLSTPADDVVEAAAEVVWPGSVGTAPIIRAALDAAAEKAAMEE